MDILALLSLIFSGISIVGTIIIGIFTVKANIKISKINNLEAVHKFEKNITKFELQFKDELWLAEILENGEFNNYNKKSQKLILKWWLKYKKENPVILLNKPTVEYEDKELLMLSAGPDAFKNIKTKTPPEDLPDPKDLF